MLGRHDRARGGREREDQHTTCAAAAAANSDGHFYWRN